MTPPGRGPGNQNAQTWEGIQATLAEARDHITQAMDHIGQMGDVLASGEPILPDASTATHLVGVTTLPPEVDIG